SLTRDPLVIELGQKQVIPGLEQSLLDMCVGWKNSCFGCEDSGGFAEGASAGLRLLAYLSCLWL
ncbi:FKBP prolyl isomerase 11, partial [Homo sapiens]